MIDNENAVTSENSGEQIVDTTSTNTTDTGVDNVSNVTENAQSEKQNQNLEPIKEFTKDDVRKIMQKRINRSHQSFFNRYGVANLEELDNKFGLVDQLTNEKQELANQNNELLNKIAFIENDINPERVEDVKAYFKGKGIVFNSDSLKQELATHPEWKNIKIVDNTPITTIKEMSPSRSLSQEVDESKEVAKMFGLNKVYHFN